LRVRFIAPLVYSWVGNQWQFFGRLDCVRATSKEICLADGVGWEVDLGFRDRA
jgi:hypothetical protein